MSKLVRNVSFLMFIGVLCFSSENAEDMRVLPANAVEHGGEHIWDDWLNSSILVTKHEFRYSDTSGKPSSREVKG